MTHTATYVRGEPGGQVPVSESTNPANALKPRGVTWSIRRHGGCRR